MLSALLLHYIESVRTKNMIWSISLVRHEKVNLDNEDDEDEDE